MSTRPKPRPKPRPRVQTSSPGPSNLASTPPVNVYSVDDEDALFIRNSTRTAQTWKRLEKLDEETEARAARGESSDDGSSDERNDSSPHRRKYRKKSVNKGNRSMPDWTKNAAAAILISSDDEDDDLVLERLESSGPKRRGRTDDNPKSKKRSRSRSKSITPPPALPLQTIQNARATVRQLMGVAPRAASPTFVGDESIDTIVLDPELADIARRVQMQSALAIDIRSSVPPENGGPDVIAIKVRWKSHPQDENPRSKVWAFRMKRGDTFRHLFDETADLAEVLSHNLIFSYDGVRVYPSATPHSLGIWAQADLEACDKATYTYIQAQRQERDSSVPQGAHSRSPSRTRSLSPTDDDAEFDTGVESDSGGETIRLTLRSDKVKDIVLMVRQTTKCGAIVKAFLKKAGLAEQYPLSVITPSKAGKGRKGAGAVPALGPMLMVDGEKMDQESPIGNADLEDGDLVEVVGL